MMMRRRRVRRRRAMVVGAAAGAAVVHHEHKKQARAEEAYAEQGAADAGYASSYAINGRIEVMRRGGNSTKILAVEYRKTVTDVLQPNGRDVWTYSSAPRHESRMNVLFGDGAVAAMRPADIDPRITQYNNEFWRPDED